MSDNEKQEIQWVAGFYGLNVDFFQKKGKVIKLYTNKGEFALKSIRGDKGIDFIQYMHLLYQRGYHRLVPVYPALDGRYGILSGNRLFYLMPWMENNGSIDQQSRHTELFRELARLHLLTSKEVEVTDSDRRQHFEGTLAEWEKEQEALDRFVEKAEESVYMSPFELLLCLFYQDISRGQQYALGKLKDWYDISKEDTKARSVVIHGKISPDHFLYDHKGTGYFSNLERAGVASPIHDLLPYISSALQTYPKRFDEGLELLGIYFKYFPFREEETALFLSYLAHPGKIFRVIDAYMSSDLKQNELQFTSRLQKQYWYMKNTEYIVSQLEEIERQRLEQLNLNQEQ